MFESRMFGEPEEPIVEYEHEDRETGEVYTSPFPVVVFTIHKELLGAGRAVGQIGFGDDAMPIIEIDDVKSPTGKVHILGSECWWSPITEDNAAALAEGPNVIKSAQDYAYELDVADSAGQN